MYKYRIVAETEHGWRQLGYVTCEDKTEADEVMLSIATALEYMTKSLVTEMRAENIEDGTFFFTKVHDKDWEERHNNPNANP